MNSILFIPQHAASLNEMMLISNGLNDRKPIFYISFPVSKETLERLAVNNSEVVMASVIHRKSRPSRIIFKGIVSRVVSSSFFDYLFNLFFVKHLVSKKIKKILFDVDVIDDLIRKKNVKKIVLTTDRTVGIELSAAIAAKKRNLDVIVASFAISADVTSSEKLRKSQLYFYEKTDSWNTAILPNGKRISFSRNTIKWFLKL